MEIILKQDMTGLGYKNDLMTVKDGYARNYLIPKGIAVIATSSEKKQLEELKKQQSFKEDKIRKEAEAIITALEGLTLKIPTKVGENGKIFGSVNVVMVANAIKTQGNLTIDRKMITIVDEPIKEIGTYKAKIRLHKTITTEISFEVVGE